MWSIPQTEKVKESFGKNKNDVLKNQPSLHRLIDELVQQKRQTGKNEHWAELKHEEMKDKGMGN